MHVSNDHTIYTAIASTYKNPHSAHVVSPAASTLIKLATLTATGQNSLFYSIYISCLNRLALSAKSLNQILLAIYFLYIGLVSLQ